MTRDVPRANGSHVLQTPNAGEGLKRLDYRVQSWDRAFAEFIQELQQSKPVVITGDLNCAHQNIDIHSPGTNTKTAGFTDVRLLFRMAWVVSDV